MTYSYTTPVTDRTRSDVTNKTSKGYFNIVDWDRIFQNSGYIHDVVIAALPITSILYNFPSLAYTDFPTPGDDFSINTLVGNIDRLRQALVNYGINISGLVALNYNWLGGYKATAPDYQDVNDWEQAIQLIHDFFQHIERYPRTGIARCGSGMTRQNGFRR